ncbi:MAG: hypothetical protein HUU20_20135 [Pirellulales bacterium]|nr:hypothetical protein [Pirellulales bacterium]
MLNAAAAVFFSCFLAYTFLARQHVDGLARSFVTEKTLQYSGPIVDLAEESLAIPLIQRLLSAEQLASIRGEIAEYRKDPSAYIADLTRKTRAVAQRKELNPLLVKVASLKERIRTFYDNTLDALVADLRIFSASNLCAAAIALLLAVWSREALQKSIVWFSLLMFIAVLYCSCLYIDNLTFFRILFRMHLGWWYSVLLCVVLAGLCLEHFHILLGTESRDAPEARSKAHPGGAPPDDGPLAQRQENGSPVRERSS